MFVLGVSDHVMIAHSFPDPFFGPAQQLHGATYAVDLEVRAPSLGPHEVVMDIGALRALLRAVLDDLDYRNLDEHPAFAGRRSTTERVAAYIAGRAARRGRGTDGRRLGASRRARVTARLRNVRTRDTIVMRVAWIVYGDLAQPTGGYVYDRLMVDGLRLRGDEVEVVGLVENAREDGTMGRLGDAGFHAIVGDALCARELGHAFEQVGRGTVRVLLVHHLTSWEVECADRDALRAMEARAVAASDHLVVTSDTSAARLAT
jgi:6-pyruvoyltetrahydropterin/6-carboxytetrahydropterin synthase